jgi:multimeric flavodoxin WrbA
MEIIKMKVLLVNGSPHKEGCTYTALSEVAKTLNDEGIETEIFWIKTKPITGCIACGKCGELGKCTFDKDVVNEFVEKHMMLTDSYSAHLFTMQVQTDQ